MTRKDYELIAKAIRDTQARIQNDHVQYSETFLMAQRDDKLRGVRRTATHLAVELLADNPAFNQQRFLTACGYGA